FGPTCRGREQVSVSERNVARRYSGCRKICSSHRNRIVCQRRATDAGEMLERDHEALFYIKEICQVFKRFAFAFFGALAVGDVQKRKFVVLFASDRGSNTRVHSA